ncbi:unnamed protein product [Paramecium sonneborni]|uniref:GPI transamidase component PIG-T n=1 Tax=Paramecium sonneborni TaxID=65129 RepID=A0A8S1KMH9_9CILI|nr:unnamed protein product [Paramecium sonneborni]
MFIFFLVYVQAQFSSKLHFHYPNADESIAEFRIINKHEIDFTKTTQPFSLFPRSFLENLHIEGKVRELYISSTQGMMPELNAPQHGVLIITNEDADQQIAINQISEIFRIAKYNMIHDQAYYYKFNGNQSYLSFMGFDDDTIQVGKVLLAQDPTDNICIDGIESILKYFGCNGKKGVAQIIDPNTIFRSSYLSLQAKFQYDESTKTAYQKIVLLVKYETQSISKIFNLDPNLSYHSCPEFDSEFIQHSTREITYNLKSAEQFRMGQLSKIQDDTNMIKYSPKITLRKFSAGPWFAFDSYIHLQVTANEDGIVSVLLYFPHEFTPIYHTLETNLESQKQFIWEKETKKIIINAKIKQNETFLVKIKFSKKLKSFEEYPHDPERGQDIITTPVIFNGELYLTSHQVTRQPYPDFSMPFNILTFSSLAMGYFFLQILGMAVDKFILNKPEKGSLAQRLLRKIFSLISF